MIRKIWTIFLLLAFLTASGIARAQEAAPISTDAPAGSAFTYQGQLKDASGPVSGDCDFQLSLWDALSGGTQTGSTLTQANVTVSEGLFTVQPDFGASAFNGSARWLEIAVRCPAGSGSYSTLSPRQPLTPAPYSLYSANADRVDGQHAAAFQQHYQNLVVVAKNGGDFTTITEALNSITTNSAANPFTIYVAPGVYTETVTMKPYVDIEGAGEQSTRITYGNPITHTRTLVGADDVELRFLSVENTAGDGYAKAIYNDHASPRLTHVAIRVTSQWSANYGIHNEYSSPTITDVTVNVTGGINNTGIENYIFCAPLMTNVTTTVSGGNYDIGIYNWNSTPAMTNVTASASGGATANYGVLNDGGSSPVMNRVIARTSGGPKAYGIYNINGSSPAMTSVTASATGGTESYGVFNEHFASPLMRDITATASGGTTNIGVHNLTSSSPTMIDVTATASGTTNNTGVRNEANSSPVMNNVTASASGGTYNFAIENVDSSPTMTNVNATASGGTWQNAAVFNTSSSPLMTNVTAMTLGGAHGYAVDNYLSSPMMVHVTAIASGGTGTTYGVYNDSSSPTIQSCVISASGGTNDGLHNVATSGAYTIKINSSQITGGPSTIYQDSHYTTYVGVSQLSGGGAFGGTYVCIGSYNGNYSPLTGACQP